MIKLTNFNQECTNYAWLLNFIKCGSAINIFILQGGFAMACQQWDLQFWHMPNSVIVSGNMLIL